MTADTFSNTLGFTIMGTGNDNNTWGSIANANVFQIFEDALANFLISAISGGTLDLSGTPPPAGASQARYAALVFTGALGSDQTLQVPNLTKFWWVNNQTSGAPLLKIKTPSGSLSTAIPQNSGWQLVICDGSNDIIVLPFNSQQVQMPDGSGAAPAYSNINEPTSGLYRAAAGDWRFSTLGVDTWRATGVTDGSSAAAGSAGQYLNAVVQTASAVPLTFATPANVTSLSIPAGDWDVWADCYFKSAFNDSAASCYAALSTVSATIPTVLPMARGTIIVGVQHYASGLDPSINGICLRVSVTSPTTYFLVAQCDDTITGAYGQIQARRRR
jgi:hypothetical protein